MTHKNGEERVVGLILKINGVRVHRLTHKICEERVDGSILEIDGVRVQRLTHNNNNISEERADGLTLWLVDGDGSWCALDCVRCEKTWRSSFVEIENEVHVRDDGLGEVEWPSRWHQGSRFDGFDGFDGAVGGIGGFDGFDGVDGTVDGLVASMASIDWRRSPMVNWGLRHRGH